MKIHKPIQAMTRNLSTGENVQKWTRYIILFFSTRPSDEYDSAPSRKYSRFLDVFPVMVNQYDKKYVFINKTHLYWQLTVEILRMLLSNFNNKWPPLTIWLYQLAGQINKWNINKYWQIPFRCSNWWRHP